MEVLIVIVLVALVGYALFLQIGARQQIDVSTAGGSLEVEAAVERTFGRTWKRVPGRGSLNLKPSLRANAPTISVDWRPAPSGGGQQVSIWVSDYTTRMGLIYHAQLVWRKKRSLANALADVAA